MVKVAGSLGVWERREVGGTRRLGRGQAWPELTQFPSCPLLTAQSVASYENESAWGGVVAERLGPQLGSVPGRAEPHCRSSAEPACKGADEDEDEDQNEGYL